MVLKKLAKIGGYVPFQREDYKASGSICIYIHKTLIHKDNCSVSNDDNEKLAIEIIN